MWRSGRRRWLAGAASGGRGEDVSALRPGSGVVVGAGLVGVGARGDLAHFVSDLVESGALDLSAIYAANEGERGYPPYDLRLMLKLLVDGYANGVVSSRKLERATYRDLAMRMLCADQHPDYRSIARFRACHLEALGEPVRAGAAVVQAGRAGRAGGAGAGRDGAVASSSPKERESSAATPPAARTIRML